MPPSPRRDDDDVVEQLDDRLRALGAPLRGFEARALFMGALTSTSPTLGPQELLPIIFGKSIFLGEDEEDARATLGLVMLLWNGLNDERRNGAIRFSAVSMSSPPTHEQLREISMRRSAELMWYLRGLAAGGDDETSFGERGERVFGDIDLGAQALGRWTKHLAQAETLEPHEEREAALRIQEITAALERLVAELMRLGDRVRADALGKAAARPSSRGHG
ncbi:MAG: hypothetical protein IT379_21865 [Deltaproteobacteria bacterium]|nr:hypothetical protein [Deltaproteobacteria bacterium]